MDLPIDLPSGFLPTIKLAEKVEAGSVIAEKIQEIKEEVFNISGQAGVSPKKVIKILKKNLGDSIEEGDVLAVKKGFFGIGKKKIKSPFTGTLVRFEEDSGNLVIKAGHKLESPEVIKAPLEGIVKETSQGKIVLTVKKDAIIAKLSIGESARGQLETINKEEVDFDDLPKNAKDKVLLVKKIKRAAVFKAMAMGTKGIITTTFNEQDFDELRSSVKEPLFIISEENYSKALKFNGKEVYLDSGNKAVILL